MLAEHPGALAWVECSTGDVLQEFVGLEDGASYRYAVLHAGGTDLDDVLAQGERLREALDFRLEPVDPAAQGSSATRAWNSAARCFRRQHTEIERKTPTASELARPLRS